MQKPTDKATPALPIFLQENIESLQGIVRSYVARAGLANGEALQSVTHEILNEATLEALNHADMFPTISQPRAWFLGIVANIIKRHRAALSRRNQHEFSISNQLFATRDGSESDFFDQVTRMTEPGPEQEIETRTQVAELLSLASPQDRRVLHLAFLQDLDTESLAHALNVSPANARVRLHRALHRLRRAWQTSNQHRQEGGHYA